MADLDSNRIFGNISDDSGFVHEAMQRLGFACAFCDLTTSQMADTLTLATMIKRAQVGPETWES